LKNKASKDTFVHEIMDKEIVSVKPTDDLDLLYCITNKKVRHLPVLLEEKSWNYFYW
jgi:CBS domain-containing protein